MQVCMQFGSCSGQNGKNEEMDTKPCCDLSYYTLAGIFPFYNIDLKGNWKITMVRSREESE